MDVTYTIPAQKVSLLKSRWYTLDEIFHKFDDYIEKIWYKSGEDLHDEDMVDVNVPAEEFVAFIQKTLE